MSIKIDLSGHVAVVTGGSGYIGRVICRTLAEAGAKVAVHYHNNSEMANRVVKDIEAMGGQAIAVQADTSDLNSTEAMRNIIQEKLGTVDIVVNAAVAQYDWTTVLEQDLKDYESQFRTCIMQNVCMAKAFIPNMQMNNWGRFIAINTECSVQAFPTQSAYVAGKRGMDGMLRVLAKEVGPYNITVNQVAPGWTITDRDRQNGTEKCPSYDDNVPLRRRGTDQDISNAVCFLASDLASYITGVYLPVCGGNIIPGL